MTQAEEIYTFACSGRSFSANRDIIGIDADGEVYEGYDGGFAVLLREGEKWEAKKAKLTPDERQELADYMIARWTAFRDGGAMPDASTQRTCGDCGSSEVHYDDASDSWECGDCGALA